MFANSFYYLIYTCILFQKIQYILDLLKKDAGVDKVVEAVSEHYMVVPETLYIKEQSQSN